MDNGTDKRSKVVVPLDSKMSFPRLPLFSSREGYDTPWRYGAVGRPIMNEPHWPLFLITTLTWPSQLVGNVSVIVAFSNWMMLLLIRPWIVPLKGVHSSRLCPEQPKWRSHVLNGPDSPGGESIIRLGKIRATRRSFNNIWYNCTIDIGSGGNFSSASWTC